MELSNYPNNFDNETNLYTVYDSLRVPLGEDYYPGDSIIHADGDISFFPSSGIITLVDQCSDPNERASTFFYPNRTNSSFQNVQLREYSKDTFKAKNITSITQQLVAEHHNGIKNSIVAIQEFLGTKHTINKSPFIGTIFGRINFLKKIIHTPKAWFEADRVRGVMPLTVKLVSKSIGTSGPVGKVIYKWDFGDGTDITGYYPVQEKIYDQPGTYSVSLTVSNSYGTDVITFDDMIKVMPEAPPKASIKFNHSVDQKLIDPDRIRTSTNKLIHLEAISQYDEVTTDKINKYTWRLLDDLNHTNIPTTKAMFSIGGLYDVVLRTDTEMGAYRITNYTNAIDVVEQTNLWLWTLLGSKSVQCNEFGLLSETFKTNSANIHPININDKFIDGNPKMKKEFWRNNGTATIDDISSGNQGRCMLFWASGRDKSNTAHDEKINFIEYSPFVDEYYNSKLNINRPWNWASLVSDSNIYFILGNTTKRPSPMTSPTNQKKTIVNQTDSTFIEEDMSQYNYRNKANGLTKNSVSFNKDGKPTNGHFSCYRTAWKENSGYILRGGTGFKDFYKTEGLIGDPFLHITRITDLPYVVNTDMQIVSLNAGIFSFSSNDLTGNYDDKASLWKSKNVTMPLFVPQENDSFIAVSDKKNRAYLSFDYDPAAFVKYEENTEIFTILKHRPTGPQWLATIF